MSPIKILLVDAIEGRGIPSLAMAIQMEKEGFARFTGNQHNEQWRWIRERLMEMTLDDLDALYGLLVTS